MTDKQRFLKEAEKWVDPTDIIAEHHDTDTSVLYVVDDYGKNSYKVLYLWDTPRRDSISVSVDRSDGTMQDVLDVMARRCCK